MLPKCVWSSQLVPSEGPRVLLSFLIWDPRRFSNERVSIVFCDVMIFLVSLNRCVLLGLFLWRHRELFIGWNHSGRQCWGSENWMEAPNTRFPNEHKKACKSEGTRFPRKSVSTSNVVNPFTRALKPPFIGRRKDFYIPRLSSNLKNILSVNMYKNVFYTPWFAKLISHIYKSATSSHLEPGLLRLHLWLSLSSTFDSSFAIVVNHQDLWIELLHSQPKWGSLISLKFPSPQFPELAKFLLSWNKKQTCDLVLIRQRKLRGLVNHVKITCRGQP
jgi:hypothetical protein